MNILSFGAGAIGTYVGGSLALIGHQVTFLERGSAVEQLLNHGLQLTIQGQQYTIEHPKAAGSLEEVLQEKKYDFAIFALKSFDTPSAVTEMLPFAANIPPVLCLSNGVENEKVLAKALGKENVIAGTVTSAVGRIDVGKIALERLRGIGIAGEHPSSNKIAEAMNKAGLNARIYNHTADMKWSKLLTNLPANASSAILDMTPAEIYANPDLFHLEKTQILEALVVMKAQGIRVVDLPGTPVRAFTFAVKSLPEALARKVLIRSIGSGRGGKMPSFHIDLHSGRKNSEVGYLNGAVVQTGKQLGICTPANQVLTDTLMALTNQEEPLDKFQHKPEAILKLFELAQKP